MRPPCGRTLQKRRRGDDQDWQIGHGRAYGIGIGACNRRRRPKDKVKVGFIGPLTGGVSANGIGGRNSADLAVKLRNADPKAKYEYEMVVLDDECKPNVGVQVATKMAADKDVIAGGHALLLGGGDRARSTSTTSSACR